ncbi:MAG: carbohydrate-binding protein [Mitsuaria chitosanitabida]|uniref:GH36-type glycosyl hydrolase domain-containing protein n=1 Tax=Roseateles chitosanitabidus TaxID=65048 RepID=UPI001B163F31|nr:glucoamylase family protein [Roseateles chitosanitabidus]MBO9685136.1 carbohydrate-binding protein [Roseateles chitosanitabidus]
MNDTQRAQDPAPHPEVAEELALLNPALGPIEPPVRAVLFGLARFEQHGRSLAQAQAVQGTAGAGQFFPRLDENVAMLQQARRLIEKRHRDFRHLGAAGKWLLDNAALIDEQTHQVRRGLPRGFFRLLPRLRDEPLAGLPRIYGIAWAWVAHTDGGFDIDLLAAYLRAYQRESALSLAELWALPTTLRVVLVENLRRLAERFATLQAARDVVHHWYDGHPADHGMARIQELEPRMKERGVAEAFWLQLDHRMEELPQPLMGELGAWLSTRLPAPAQSLARQQDESIKDLQSIRNAITALRRIDQTDWRKLIQSVSPVMQTLAESPVHAAEATDTQDLTLHEIERLARRCARTELEIAQRLIELTRRAGPPVDGEPDRRSAPIYWWRGAGRPTLHAALGLPERRWRPHDTEQRQRWSAAAYLGGLVVLGLLGLSWLMSQARADAPLWMWCAAALLAAGPIGEAVVALTNRWISELTRPTRLPRLDFSAGLPDSERTLVVMPVLLPSEASVAPLVAQLEQHHLANPERLVQFALLSDHADAYEEHQPGDTMIVVTAADAIAALNERHGALADGRPRFLLLHRQREWSPTERRWIGWERKRGKLELLLRLLATRGLASPFVDLGPLSTPAEGVRHLITLDADTDMPPGRLRALVGTAAHPMNRPRLADPGHRVVEGYAILQPRVLAPMPEDKASTPYHRLFVGQFGIDPYSAVSSEIFQDLFGEGSFTGKGLLDVRACHAALGERLPEGQVLSHDLLEGSLARCAGVSDITLVEDSPMHADVAHARLHRWTRGDWQLLPFMARAGRYGLAPINRWKLIDNLRRSLVAPMSLGLVLLALGGEVLPLGLTLLVVAAAFAIGPLVGALAGLVPSRDGLARRHFYRETGHDLLRALGLAAWHLALLLHLSLLYLDAITRALWRQWVTRRHLLEWTTAAAAQAAAKRELPALVEQHLRVPVTAAVLGGVLLLASLLGAPVRVGAAFAVLIVWALSPLWIWWASAARAPLWRREATLDPQGREYLWRLARDTWRFYDQHVGAADHHLPPDNVQLTPHLLVAHRTSPTNIGLYLLTVACAREFGFIGLVSMTERLAATLDTLERLPRWNGHFYNWYDTESLVVLAPGYVSAVDSGNCSAHLLAVARACELAAELDAEQAAAAPRDALARTLRRLRVIQPPLSAEGVLAAGAALVAALSDPGNADLQAEEQQAVLGARADAARAELEALAQVEGHEPTPTHWLLRDLLAQLASSWRDQGAAFADARLRLRDLAARFRALGLAADYRPLFDPERGLLRIGWRGDAQQLDDNHYDLLASEARLTSLVAIAKGDLPPEHWRALGRPFFSRDGAGDSLGLKSWSGSMFEYLMPSLVLREPAASALGRAIRTAVAEQRLEAVGKGTPWGISESAIAGQDHTLAYQYGPQGVQTLALARLATDERVIAPYAAVMAALVAPVPVVANLQAYERLGARGDFGFIEAVDYTPQRQTAGAGHTLVRTYMAHHQAMGFAALANLLCDDAPRRWLMTDPHLKAVATLLHERAPREVAPLALPASDVLPRKRPQRKTRMVRETEPLTETLPLTHMLTNGRYAVVLRSHGGGYSNWDGVSVTRWRDDLLRDQHGSFLFLRRAGEEDWFSTTARPAPDPRARYETRMQAERVLLEARWRDLHACTTVWVSPEDDCELRQVEITHRGDRPLTLELVSCFEATLAPQRGDEAHPAFSNLFIQARWDAAEHALHLRRRPRLFDEAAMRAVHFLAGIDDGGPAGQRPHRDGTARQDLADGVTPAMSHDHGGPRPEASALAAGHFSVGEVTPVADRARWLGRYGSSTRPVGDAGAVFVDDVAETADPGAEGEPGRLLDTGLDPVAGIRVPLTLAPGATVRLTFCTAAARDGDLLAALVDKYRQPAHVERAASMSHTMGGIRLRELSFDTATWGALLQLNTLITGQAAREAAHPRTPGGRVDRRALWRFGISGDRPILAVTISGEEGIDLVRALKKALRLWTAHAVGVDLVVLNEEPPSYLAPVQQALQALQSRLQGQNQGRPAHLCAALHVLRDADLQPDERLTLQMLTRVRLQADGRALAQQLARWLDDLRPAEDVPRLPVAHALVGRPSPDADPRAPEGRFDGTHGGFSFEVSPDRHPSRPWVNVLANPDFGCQVTEIGAGYTWAGNSRMHQVTPWSNDPLLDPPGEWLLLHDLDHERVWPLGRQLHRAAPLMIEHGIGYTRSRQHLDDLTVELCWCVDKDASIKQVQVSIRADARGDGRVDGRGRRRLRLVALAEWQLGSARSERLSVTTHSDWLTVGPIGAGLPQPERALSLQATQRDHLGGFGEATAALCIRPGSPQVRLDTQDWTCDRREFFDGAGRMVLPTGLSRRCGGGLDACAGLGARLDLDGTQPAQLAVLLGHARSPDEAHALMEAAWQVDPAERLAAQRQQWPALLGGIQVSTPDPRFDALTNHWLPYQTLVCRMWARAGFYQAGGAFGYRDQLQDAMALTDVAPQLLAQQIRRNAARQFPEGDVQHWWHEPGGAGVRTHFSDDRLWLPYAVAHYLARTGDVSLLDQTEPFLIGQTVPEGAEDIYESPRTDGPMASVYEHAARAIDRSLDSGAHGLPLFGTGDWNDGMNRVGHEGRGESVWMAWFLCQVIEDFAPVATARGEHERAQRWKVARDAWVKALDDAGWDGAWYRRGFFDDGSPLGSARNSECRIDLIAQSWAVLTGAADPAHARQAMASACAQLLDPVARLARLLHPPLAVAQPSAGYIQSYAPGVRENGGQYNHAAVWALMALARLGQRDTMWQVYTGLSPAHRWADPRLGPTYAIEPYVMAGDIYSQPPWVGRGGWSWYSGSAGWLLRASLESICGVVVAQGRVRVEACLPVHWDQAEVRLRHEGRWLRVIVCANESACRAALAREPGARRESAGESVELASLSPEQALVVVSVPEMVKLPEAPPPDGAGHPAGTARPAPSGEAPPPGGANSPLG